LNSDSDSDSDSLANAHAHAHAFAFAFAFEFGLSPTIWLASSELARDSRSATRSQTSCEPVASWFSSRIA